MKVLYIGQYTEGTTSKMRADILKKVLQPSCFKVIDTHIPFFKKNKIWRSTAFRLNRGPVINALNNYIIKELKNTYFDLIWVDKAVFIRPKTTQLIRKSTKQLIHFTPDMAFYQNQSRFFYKSITSYDLLITTKRKELPFYEKMVEKERLLLITQGFDRATHKNFFTFEKKENTVVFIGLAEKSRFEVIQHVIDNHINVKLVGYGWKDFVRKNQNNKYLDFKGSAVFGEEYSKLISSSKFGLGLLSKNFPELHTTRTFEIPACGTALITEKNEETSLLFNEDEVVFYNSLNDLVLKIKAGFSDDIKLKNITEKGTKRVLNSGYDYESIIQSVVSKMGI